MARVEITEACTACGICVRSCPALILIITFDEEEEQLECKDQVSCLECRACEFLCPHEAIWVYALKN